MRKTAYLLLLLATAVLASCDGSKFNVTADIKSLGNQNVRIIYLGDEGVSDQFVVAKDGKFSFEGHSSSLTVVSILEGQNETMCRFVVSGGDKIELTGDFMMPHHYQCKGNDISEQWMQFERAHSVQYESIDCTVLDDAIEEYVKKNPKSVVSTLLMAFDYSDAMTDKAKKLIASIDREAMQSGLMASIQNMQEYNNIKEVRLYTMMLCNLDGDFESVNAMSNQQTLFYWWLNNNESRRTAVREMKRILKDHQNLRVIDINMSADTVGWRVTMRNDSTQWKHYWAPGGVMDAALNNLKIRRLPTYILTDSIGRQLYRGIDLNEIEKNIK